MSSPALAPIQLRSANFFELVSQTGRTKLTYDPHNASFEYDGPEGCLNFRGPQITRQATPAGEMISVVLYPQRDTGSVTFTLFLPTVNIESAARETFTTYAIKAHHTGSKVRAGAQITYQVEYLKGMATAEMMPR